MKELVALVKRAFMGCILLGTAWSLKPYLLQCNFIMCSWLLYLLMGFIYLRFLEYQETNAKDVQTNINVKYRPKGEVALVAKIKGQMSIYDCLNFSLYNFSIQLSLIYIYSFYCDITQGFLILQYVDENIVYKI